VTGTSVSDLRATDVLANERTFLAYARTALAFIAFGFVIARFTLYVREAAALVHLTLPPQTGIGAAFGSAMAVFGAACGLYGGYRYVVTARALRRDQVAPLGDRTALLGAAVIAAIGLIIAFVLPTVR